MPYTGHPPDSPDRQRCSPTDGRHEMVGGDQATQVRAARPAALPAGPVCSRGPRSHAGAASPTPLPLVPFQGNAEGVAAGRSGDWPDGMRPDHLPSYGVCRRRGTRIAARWARRSRRRRRLGVRHRSLRRLLRIVGRLGESAEQVARRMWNHVVSNGWPAPDRGRSCPAAGWLLDTREKPL